MKVFIHHRGTLHFGVITACIFAEALLLFIYYNVDSSVILAAMFFVFVIMLLAGIYGFLQSNLKTTVTIEGGELKIDYPFGERDIAVDSIKALCFRHKKTEHRSGETGVTTYDFRVTLDITVKVDIGNTRYISLNDNAGQFINGKQYFIPDDELPLYNIYKCLCDLTGITGSDDIMP